MYPLLVFCLRLFEKGTLIKKNYYGETQYITGITTWHSYLATEMTKTVVKITKLFLQCSNRKKTPKTEYM